MSIDRSAIGNFALEAIDEFEEAYEDEMAEGAEINVEEMILVCAISVQGQDGKASSSVVYHSSQGRFWSTAGLLDAAKESIYRED